MDSLGHGVYELLHITSGEFCLIKRLTPMLAKKIKDKINIQSGKPWHYPISSVTQCGGCLEMETADAIETDVSMDSESGSADNRDQ